MSLEISTQGPGTYLSKNLRNLHSNSFLPFTCPIYSIPFGPFGSFHDMILLKLVNRSWSKVQTKTKSEIELAWYAYSSGGQLNPFKRIYVYLVTDTPPRLILRRGSILGQDKIGFSAFSRRSIFSQIPRLLFISGPIKLKPFFLKSRMCSYEGWGN